jgi:Transposase DDE domain/Transposase domain (DUF772)
MLVTLRQQLTKFAHMLQNELFPTIQAEVGELTEPAKRLTAVLAMIPLRRFIPVTQGWNGRPAKDRYCIACAYVAKSVYNFPHTRALLERLHSDAQLRALCGWRPADKLPHESTFSRAFAEFAEMELPQFVHAALIRDTQKDRLIGHIARDSTAIENRERFPRVAPKKSVSGKTTRGQARLALTQPEPPAAETSPAALTTPALLKQPAPQRKSKPRFQRWKGGKRRQAPKADTRLHRQRTMSLDAMLEELPRQCDIGVKTSSKGHQQYWRGFKLHIDVADGQIPISAVLTSASLHDSQVAIPLATMSSQRVTSLYDVMDSAYDAQEILEHSRGLGHVPIVDPANRVGKTKNVIVPPKLPRQFSWAEEERFKERTMIERVNGRLKDEFGGRFVRVRGAVKVMAHLMFGVLVLTVDQLIRLNEA